MLILKIVIGIIVVINVIVAGFLYWHFRKY